MGEETFCMLLHLIEKGYTIKFSKDILPVPTRVYRIELQKEDNHQMQLVDLSITDRQFTRLTPDQLIRRSLEKADWDFRYNFEKEN